MPKLMTKKKLRSRRRQSSPTWKTSGSGSAGIFDRLKAVFPSLSVSWLACIPLVALIVGVWGFAASAQDEPLTPEYVQGVLNAIWVLVAAILVIFMNAGFGMLETGFCRQKNAVNILSKNLIVFALATIAFWAFGFSFMFGSANAFIGAGGFFLSSSDPGTYGLDPFPAGLPISVFFLFQAAFAGTAATIVSGAVAERIKFVDFLIFSLLLTGISYPITGHWVWTGDGWLAKMGFSDFAGSTVVHSVGGWAALMGAAILGPRIGKYNEDGSTNALPGHNMALSTLGCLILWIGWFGFNPGSELAASEAVPYIAVTTNLAAAAGGIAATITAWIISGKPDLSMIVNGILAGLVAITAPCASVEYWAAIVIGLIGGIIVVFAVLFFDQIKIDDPVGAISVHLVNGAWGTFAVGLFANPNVGGDAVGLLYGGGLKQIGVQLVGILAIGAFTVVLTGIFWVLLKSTLGIRVTAEEEIMGLDVGEHGMQAYSGFLTESSSIPGEGAGVADG